MLIYAYTYICLYMLILYICLGWDLNEKHRDPGPKVAGTSQEGRDLARNHPTQEPGISSRF